MEEIEKQAKKEAEAVLSSYALYIESIVTEGYDYKKRSWKMPPRFPQNVEAFYAGWAAGRRYFRKDQP